MGKCVYCGKPAGFLTYSHPECRNADSAAYDELVRSLAGFSSKSPAFNNLTAHIESLATAGQLSALMKDAAIYDGLKRFANGACEISLPPSEVARQVQAFVRANGLRAKAGMIHIKTLNTIEQIEALSLVAEHKGATLQKSAAFGINIGRDETPIWSFLGTKLYEERTHTRRVGGGRGVSVRVAKGVYYHTGHFKSHTETTIEEEHIDTGTLLVTDKTVYFAGKAKSLKIPFHKIVTVAPCPGGVEIMKDGSSAKPEFFVTGEPWFTTNLLALAMRG
jgi:hypothetical protein